MRTRYTPRIGAGLCLVYCLVNLWIIGVVRAAEPITRNHFVPYPHCEPIAEGISWPAGQALPVFATPAPKIDTLEVQHLTADEQITFSALQGNVNRKQPRLYLLDARSDEGRDTWLHTPTIGLGSTTPYSRQNKYELVAKYTNEFHGLVLYDPERSPHYRNLAGTVAALHRSLPVTPEVHEQLKAQGIHAEVVADLTDLTKTTPLEIYEYLHDTYWGNCEKRLLISAKPHNEAGGGDYHHTRDIAAACGAAVVWLDNRIPEERNLMRRFFSDMKAGEAVVLGWYSTERSGITTASEFGIGTLPADHYISGSVHSGVDHRILIPEVPKMPALENRVYVAIFISDGDNIQYAQRAMRRIWDRNASVRGKVALNWTTAPGLVDIGPGILNYFYTTATPKDCFVSGPSGMGYMMPVNTLREPGAPIGAYTQEAVHMDGYTRLTETYMQRSGLRVITIWDDATPMQRASYVRHCRSLYGATVHNFRDVPSVSSSVEAGRLRFEKLVIPYTGTYEHISRSLMREIGRWDRKAPLFLAYQVDIWNEMKPDRIVALHDDFVERFPGEVEFVRADHYFNLHNEAHELPYNLVLSPETSVESGEPAANPEWATDGTPVTLWSAAKQDNQWLQFDFGTPREVTRFVLRHAGEQGLDPTLNTRDFTLLFSTDGSTWHPIGAYKDNKLNVTDVEPTPVTARHIKIQVNHPGADGVARIADVEIYGRRTKSRDPGASQSTPLNDGDTE